MQKRQSVSQKFAYWLKVVSLGMVLGLGLQFAQAWTAPTQAPPLESVSGPITTGATSQTKAGPLVVGNAFMVTGEGMPFQVGNAGDVLVTGGADSDWALYKDGVGSIGIRPNRSIVFMNGNVGIGTNNPIRMLQVNGELSITRNDKVGFINISDPSGNGGGSLILRGLTNGGATETNADIILHGNTTIQGGGNGLIFPDGTKQTTAAGGGASGNIVAGCDAVFYTPESVRCWGGARDTGYYTDSTCPAGSTRHILNAGSDNEGSRYHYFYCVKN